MPFQVNIEQHVVFRETYPEFYPREAFEGPLHMIEDPSLWENRGYGIGMQHEDEEVWYLREPTSLPPNDFAVNYKRLIGKKKQYSVLPKDQDGNFYVEIVPTITGLFHIRVFRQTETPQGEKLGRLNLETGFYANSRDLYLVSADNLLPLSKEAAGYLKVSPLMLKNLMKGDTTKISIGRDVPTVCRDANLYLALLQGALDSDSKEKSSIFYSKKSISLESSSFDQNDLPVEAKTLFAFLDQHPTLFPQLEYQNLGCSIVRTPGEVALADPGGKCGILHENERMIWLRLPMRFADGSYGLRNEFIQIPNLKSSGPAGSAVLGRDREKRYLLLINMRIPTASLEVELSKGFKKIDEDLAAGAKRETLEEMHREVLNIQLLGSSQTGLEISTHESYPVYLAEIGEAIAVSEGSQGEDIRGVLALNINEIKQAYKEGYLTYWGTQYSFKCPNLAFALGKILLQDQDF